MFRQIVTPKNTELLLHIPDEFVGRRVEVIAFDTDETESVESRKKYTIGENREFYRKFRFGTLSIKFNRDELYDR